MVTNTKFHEKENWYACFMIPTQKNKRLLFNKNNDGTEKAHFQSYHQRTTKILLMAIYATFKNCSESLSKIWSIKRKKILEANFSENQKVKHSSTIKFFMLFLLSSHYIFHFNSHAHIQIISILLSFSILKNGHVQEKY